MIMAWLGTKTFTATDKYNPEEINRVGENLQYLVDLLASYTLTVTLPYTLKTDFAYTDFPYISKINELKANVNAVKNSYFTVIAPALVESAARVQAFDYVEANKFELNLQAIYETANDVIQAFMICGTFNCGQGVTIL